jgi:DNA-binding response OmpR family regulator
VVTIEPAARRLSLDDRELPLTTTEYDILACLVNAAGQVVSRVELMGTVFGRDANPADRSLDVHISRVRQKLGAHRSLILTVRGSGYMLRLDRSRIRDVRP